MKLVSLNIEVNKHHDLVLPFLVAEKPDIICLQELLEEDLPRYKDALPGYQCHFKKRGYVTDTVVLAETVGKYHGVAIFARELIAPKYTYYVGNEENLKIPYEKYIADETISKNNVVVWATVPDPKGGKPVTIATTHFTLTEGGESTPYQLQTLDALFAALAPLGEFALVGDMNAPRGNETFRRMAEKWKDNIPMGYETSLDQRLHRVPGLMRMVDCLFTTPTHIAKNVRLVDGLSDHMAIVADIHAA